MIRLLFLVFGLLPGVCAAQDAVFRIDTSAVRQVMEGFGASDAWRMQHIGLNWPLEKKEQIADWLFSRAFDADGHPRGIGLSLWRFLIGSGSAELGDRSEIDNVWNRTECFLSADGRWDFTKQAGQQWFLEAARARGVERLLAFSIAPPYFWSKNGRTASEGKEGMNIQPDCYDDYAVFLAEVLSYFAKERNVVFDFLSPVNEPQWDWNTRRQDGTFATNADCYRLVKALNRELGRRKLSTQIVFGEAGAIGYLYRDDTDTPAADNQIEEFYTSRGKYSLKGMWQVRRCVSGHSYWSTYPVEKMITARQELRRKLEETDLEYWQTEYCIMEQNAETKGGWGRDLGMDMALYLARIIHYDLTVAGASSWQWWTAVSPYDYKDGLVYVDDGRGQGIRGAMPDLDKKLRQDGVCRPSKMLWVLGNYSRFVRPGMQRVEVVPNRSDSDLLVSAYCSREEIVVVVVNIASESKTLSLEPFFGSYRMYETSESADLSLRGESDGRTVRIAPRTVVTLVGKR